MSSQPATVGRARRGGERRRREGSGAPPASPVSAEAGRALRVAPDLALDGHSRGDTARAFVAAKKDRAAVRSGPRVHFFLGGERSACGKSRQRQLGTVDVDCGSCRRVATAIVRRWGKA